MPSTPVLATIVGTLLFAILLGVSLLYFLRQNKADPQPCGEGLYRFTKLSKTKPQDLPTFTFKPNGDAFSIISTYLLSLSQKKGYWVGVAEWKMRAAFDDQDPELWPKIEHFFASKNEGTKDVRSMVGQVKHKIANNTRSEMVYYLTSETVEGFASEMA